MRYLKLYIEFVRNSIIREMMFRTHFILSFTARLIWFLSFILLYHVIFQNITSLGAMSYDQALLYISIFYLIDTVGFTLFIKNFSTMPEYIADGRLDTIITKPADSQFFVSLRYFSIVSLAAVVPPLILMIRQITILQIPLTAFNVIAFLIAFTAAIAIYYALWFITLLILFWVIRVDALHEFFVTLWRFMQFPPSIFQQPLRFFFIGVVPILFTVIVPTDILQGIYQPLPLAALAASAIISLYISRVLWKIGLKRYQSTN